MLRKGFFQFTMTLETTQAAGYNWNLSCIYANLIAFWTLLAKPTTSYAFGQLDEIDHL